MKRVLVSLFISILVLGILYLPFAFYYLCFDATKWSEPARGVYGIMGIFCSFIAVGLYHDNLK